MKILAHPSSHHPDPAEAPHAADRSQRTKPDSQTEETKPGAFENNRHQTVSVKQRQHLIDNSPQVADHNRQQQHADASPVVQAFQGLQRAADNGLRSAPGKHLQPVSGGPVDATPRQMYFEIKKKDYYSEGDIDKNATLKKILVSKAPAVREKLVAWANDQDTSYGDFANEALAVKAAEEAVAKTEEQPIGPAREDAPTGAVHALSIEQQVSDGTRQAPSAAAYLNANWHLLLPRLRTLFELAERSDHLDDLLQIHRFTGTFEFQALQSHKETNKGDICGKISHVVAGKLEGRMDPGMLVTEIIPDPWGVNPMVLTALKKGAIKDAPHGVETEEASPIGLARFAQTIAELKLMIDTLDEIWRITTRLRLITSPEAWFALIKRILEGTVRRYKVDSIRELVLLYQQHADELMFLIKNNRIMREAEEGLHAAMCMAIQGEGHRAKEQKKMLLGLILHLRSHEDEVCTAYEPQGTQANFDMAFKAESLDETRIVEVESIPAEKRPDAHKYYQQQYAGKLKSIKTPKTIAKPVIYLMIPPETKLPAAEIIKIKADPTLRIINIDQIQPSDAK